MNRTAAFRSIVYDECIVFRFDFIQNYYFALALR